MKSYALFRLLLLTVLIASGASAANDLAAPDNDTKSAIAETLTITVIQSQFLTAKRLNATGNRHYQTSNDDETVYTVKTVAGNTAYIKTGKVTKTNAIQLYPNVYGSPALATNPEPDYTSTGFAVTAKRIRNTAVLDIAPWSDVKPNNAELTTQSAQTKLKVNLGEWVEIGSVSHALPSAKAVKHWQTGGDQLHILIKVEAD